MRRLHKSVLRYMIDLQCREEIICLRAGNEYKHLRILPIECLATLAFGLPFPSAIASCFKLRSNQFSVR
jgi:hypothetical protein